MAADIHAASGGVEKWHAACFSLAPNALITFDGTLPRPPTHSQSVGDTVQPSRCASCLDR